MVHYERHGVASPHLVQLNRRSRAYAAFMLRCDRYYAQYLRADTRAAYRLYVARSNNAYRSLMDYIDRNGLGSEFLHWYGFIGQKGLSS